MKGLRPWLVLALVFLAGFVTGVAVTRGVVRHMVQNAMQNPDRVRELIERRIIERLELDASQREKAHEILAQVQEDSRGLRRESAPRFWEIVSNAEAQIASLLPSRQPEEFKKLKVEN